MSQDLRLTEKILHPAFLFTRQNVASRLHSIRAAGTHLAQMFVLLLFAEIVEYRGYIKHFFECKHLEHFGSSMEAAVDLFPCNCVELRWVENVLRVKK